MDNYIYGGASDIGYRREVNEDFIDVKELDEQTLFAIVADGAGSKTTTLQPASIVASEILGSLRRIFAADKELFISRTELFLMEALLAANRVLGAFKMGNEELYAGFGASVTCCVMKPGGAITFCHAGNTRLYLVRAAAKDKPPTIRQLTQDHTKARRLVDEGLLTIEHYHTHPDRLHITSGLGIVTDPVVQCFSGQMRANDILLMTTDGIHYAIVPEAIMQLTVQSENCESAARTLIEAAKLEKYPDNMSSVVIWNRN